VVGAQPVGSSLSVPTPVEVHMQSWSWHCLQVPTSCLPTY
jgi:hypothetical protein